MASLKAKVAVGALILQNKSNFSSSSVSPICQICHTESAKLICHKILEETLRRSSYLLFYLPVSSMPLFQVDLRSDHVEMGARIGAQFESLLGTNFQNYYFSKAIEANSTFSIKDC
jgi:hypothetical protein